MLQNITSPQDIKKFNPEDLKNLAEAIREKIIITVSENGGHLASSLGAVELAIALHYCFDTPKDKVVWDVGHQTYAHKILTGRYNNFHTLRQHQGLSGFTKRSESAYDPFGAGHASTSISAALGIACGRDIKQENFKVIAVIGDGALTGGEALEGLNNAGYLNKDILIILNDNHMSIGANVGALSEYSKNSRNIEQKEIYQKVKKNYLAIKEVLGDKYLDLAEELKNNLFTVLKPEAVFTKLGFDYSGPIDGHDLNALIEILEKLKSITGPKILHIHTQKGKGYLPAENNAGKFHGVGAFNIATGEKIFPACSSLTYGQSFGDIMVKLGKENKNIVAITAAMCSGTGLEKFAVQFPERFFDTGIAEEHAVTFAAGLAAEGLRPVFAVYSSFLQRGFDQTIHDVALQKLPVIFAIDRAGLVGDDGPTHHGVFDLSYLLMIPNLIITAPKDENELQDLFYSAAQYNLPTAIRYPRGEGAGVCINEERKYIAPGQAEILSNGDDVLIIGIGRTVAMAEAAAKILRQENIQATVVNARFAKPLDPEVIELANKIKKVIVIEENVLIGGLGNFIKQKTNSENIKFELIGLPDEFIEQGEVAMLLEKYGISAANTAERAKIMINGCG
jgi:1-deoxy-D-xylulose-5-phosphate synthase